MKVLEEMAHDGAKDKRKELEMIEKCIEELGDAEDKPELSEMLRKMREEREVYVL